MCSRSVLNTCTTYNHSPEQLSHPPAAATLSSPKRFSAESSFWSVWCGMQNTAARSTPALVNVLGLHLPSIPPVSVAYNQVPVVPWETLVAFCRVTLHDIQFVVKSQSLPGSQRLQTELKEASIILDGYLVLFEMLRVWAIFPPFIFSKFLFASGHILDPASMCSLHAWHKFRTFASRTLVSSAICILCYCCWCKQ